MEKECKKCSIVKDVSEFYKKRGTSYQSYCKKCSSTLTKAHYIKNKKVNIKKLLKGIGFYKCSTCKIFKTPRKFSKDSSKDSGVANICKPCFKLYSSKYNKDNKVKIAKYYKDRYHENPIFNTRMRLKNRLNNCLSRGKKGNTLSIVGCSHEDLVKYLNNNQFGFKCGDEGVDIDHIIPMKEATTNAQVEELFHYSNLQLLPSEYNRHIKKDNKFNKKHLEEWIKKNS